MFQKHEYVYAVYQEKNFTKAAEKLFISQPSLSAAIKKLEKELGAPLFERGGKGAALTEIGREYIVATEKIRSIEADFLNKIHDIYQLETGKITVGGSNYLSSYVLPQIIKEFQYRYPKVEVVLKEANSWTLREMLQQEEIDLLVDSFGTPEETVQAYPLLRETILLCVPADWPINESLRTYQVSPEEIYRNTVDFSKVVSVPLQKFQNESFVLLKNGADMYYRAMQIFEENQISPKISFQVDQLNISYALAESGMGACFVTDTLFQFRKARENIALYRVGNENFTRTLYAAHKKQKYCSSAMQGFIGIAKEVLLKIGDLER